MTDWRRRTFLPGDDETIVGLWNATLVRDPISATLFRRQTLLDPSFDPAGCFLAERDGRAVGFALALAPREAGRFSGAAGSGRLVGLGVLPEARGQGIGGALLEAAVGFLRERGCTRVGTAAHEYYAAGIDREAYGAGIIFLTRRGFREVGEAVAMGRQLYDLEWPAEVRAAAARLASEGVQVRPVRPEDAYPLAVYFRAEFPTWVEFFTRKLDAGHPAEEMIVATHEGRVVGYCQHLDSDHVGPFGVAKDYRNRGIGSVMLYRLLDGMRARGYKFAWFGETGRARPYYERAGFRVTRTYALLRRDLSGGPGVQGASDICSGGAVAHGTSGGGRRGGGMTAGTPGSAGPPGPPEGQRAPGVERVRGGIVRGRRDRLALALCFTGHEFGESLPEILDNLEGRGVPASFFLTGAFLRHPVLRPLVGRLVQAGHYLGPRSDGHLLYCAWTPQRPTLVARQEFAADLEANLAAIAAYGVPRAGVTHYIPPYEHYNEEIVAWSEAMGLTVVGYTPGTLSAADWTPLDYPRYRATDEIYESIYRYEADDPDGLNGFLLLMHAGAGSGRPDKSSRRLGELLDFLIGRGYRLERVPDLLAG